jgi:sulfatase maturation enzyme AslB (radical SAM superfamily)
MPVSSSLPLEPPYLTAEEIEAFAPYPLPPNPAGRWARLKDRLEEAGCFGPGQIGGRRWPIGCVSLEVTQRCNLDCSLCYLSEHSEAVRDISLGIVSPHRHDRGPLRRAYGHPGLGR